MDDTEFSAQEFRENIRWRLGLTPHRLPNDCDVWGSPLLVEHAYQCKVGGLINLRHNILADDWGDLYEKFLTPSAVSNEPIIHTGNQLTGTGEGAKRAREEATDQATHARIAIVEDPAEGGPGGEHEYTDKTPGDNNCGNKGVHRILERTPDDDLRRQNHQHHGQNLQGWLDRSESPERGKLKNKEAPQGLPGGPPKLHPSALNTRGVKIQRASRKALRCFLIFKFSPFWRF